mmetsp:Transcript_29195/g.53852  ORF Transcript_29195/g.53852 Transcript_29195/m.53852 type:complete len:705 (-) Transcript_29195:178-2292(-)|eukprot:CAMPEP_0201894340 /NCGR_PEP_ID=MMETSP0902-20130614/40526_1 /ASSEMBLY_ACC=CAM_ASM_000551 /TAXON_ID=420261 /ORGANISM="Thalassiosira antarctica, Strain CCMP982" /LENGTH=704 /DNA_ID=CAMNT_0048426369 /DNA_START=45 /DNA_END=2159 /DNA_ORIENTATION=+
MKTYQLKFLAWTFSAFLPPDDPDAEKEVDYYELLDVSRNANADDIKKAYRKRSLQLHPDKLRQRGMRYQGEIITEEEARSRFQQMKGAYDTLSDPKKREIYDALGHKGMDFVINPSKAWDPHALLGNLAKSSVFDRAKLMALVLIFFGLILLQPILVCAKIDQMLEKNGGALENASWVALLIPFWLFAACYGCLLIIGKAVLPLLQWISFVVGILFLTLKFDEVLSWDYAVLFIPFYIWMLLRLFEAKREMREVQTNMSKMVTIEYIEKFVINEKKQDEDGNDIEDQLHRSYNDLNEEERDQINKEYIIVHVTPKAPAPGDDENDEEDDFDRIERSPEYQEARARHEYATKSIHRIVLPEIPLMVLIIVQLDMNKDWNWGLTFLPLWISMLFECCGGCYGFFCTSALAHIEVQEAMADHFAKDQESKNEDGEESKDNDEEKAEVNQTEGGGGAKSEDTAIGKKSVTVEAAEAGNSEKSSVDKGIDTAISVKTETTNAESEESKAESEAKVPEDGDEDDEFMFEMDDDTYQFYQQAEQEAENKATEAQSKAIGSFCNIIFQTIIAALFAVKLNQVYEEQDEQEMDGTSSFSSFWLLFPFLLISGCIICFFACAIFGADSIDTAMSSDDASENGDNDGGDEEAANTDNNGASPVITTPTPSPGVEGVAGKKDDESTAEVSTSGENAGNGTVEAVDTDQESAMDDLD